MENLEEHKLHLSIRLKMLAELDEDHGGESEPKPNKKSIEFAMSFIKDITSLSSPLFAGLDGDGNAVIHTRNNLSMPPVYCEITFRDETVDIYAYSDDKDRIHIEDMHPDDPEVWANLEKHGISRK